MEIEQLKEELATIMRCAVCQQSFPVSQIAFGAHRGQPEMVTLDCLTCQRPLLLPVIQRPVPYVPDDQGAQLNVLTVQLSGLGCPSVLCRRPLRDANIKQLGMLGRHAWAILCCGRCGIFVGIVGVYGDQLALPLSQPIPISEDEVLAFAAAIEGAASFADLPPSEAP